MYNLHIICVNTIYVYLYFNNKYFLNVDGNIFF